MKNPKLLQLSNTYKTYAQLLQDSWTASANRTGCPDNGFLHSLCKQLWTDSFCCFLDGFCNENVYIKHANDLQSSSNDLQSSSNDLQSSLFDSQLHDSALLAVAEWTSRL